MLPKPPFDCDLTPELEEFERLYAECVLATRRPDTHGSRVGPMPT